MDEKFEQKYYSRTAEGIYRIGYDTMRLMKRMAYYDKYYDNINYIENHKIDDKEINKEIAKQMINP